MTASFLNSELGQLARLVKESRPTLTAPSRLAAEFHAYLARKGCSEWTIYTDGGLQFVSAAEKYLKQIECEDAVWAPMTEMPDQAPQFCDLARDEHLKLHPLPAGCLLLPKWRVAVARWHTYSGGTDYVSQIHFCAARSIQDLQRFRDALLELRRKERRPVWHVISGDGPTCEAEREEGLTWDSVILPEELRNRLHRQAVQFFDESTSDMYRQLGLAHKRGILLWGPPGNGKTSIVRIVASLRPGVAALCLQPGSGFNDDALRRLMDWWRMDAPSILVIEDLDWMLSNVTVSTFLNLLDGVDSKAGKGQLLIATTNHPDKLDPAINNRPGRFDVAFEVPSPCRNLREQYFRKQLPDVEPSVHGTLAGRTDGLSFAHLREVLLAAGHGALQQGRHTRSADDLLAAANTVRQAHQTAKEGFIGSNPLAFGFGELVGPVGR